MLSSKVGKFAPSHSRLGNLVAARVEDSRREGARACAHDGEKRVRFKGRVLAEDSSISVPDMYAARRGGIGRLCGAYVTAGGCQGGVPGTKVGGGESTRYAASGAKRTDVGQTCPAQPRAGPRHAHRRSQRHSGAWLQFQCSACPKSRSRDLIHHFCALGHDMPSRAQGLRSADIKHPYPICTYVHT